MRPKGTNYKKKKGNGPEIEPQPPVKLDRELPKEKRKTVRKKYAGAAIIDNSQTS